MRRSLTLFALLSAFSVFALADSWSGRLIDADCYQHAQNKSAASCDPSPSTTTFAILVSDKAYNFDDAGNAKATATMKSQADRSADPTKLPSTRVMVKVSGTKDGDNIKVDTIEVQ